MKTSSKKKLLITLLQLCLVFVLGAFAFTFKKQSVLPASADSITATETAGETEFYMEKGAGVKVANGTGIRFLARLNEAYWNGLAGDGVTRTISASVTANGVTQTKNLDSEPTFKNGEFVISIDVSYTDLTEEVLAQTSALDFSAECFITVEKAETATRVIGAYGDTGVRSMRAVANAAYTDKGGDFYQSETLEQYFDLGETVETLSGGFLSDGTGAINASVLEEAESVEIYYGAERLTDAVANVGNDLVTFEGIDVSEMTFGAERYLTVLADGKFYNYNMNYANGIYTADNLLTLNVAAEGYHYIVEDIDASTLGSVQNTAGITFNGVLDGLGNTVSNITYGAALFNRFGNATAKNLNLVGVSASAGGLLGMYTVGTNVLENCYFQTSVAPADNYGGLFREVLTGSSSTLENVIIDIPVSARATTGFYSSVQGATSASVALENCYFIGGNGKYFGSTVRSGCSTPTTEGEASFYSNVAFIDVIADGANPLTFETAQLTKVVDDYYMPEIIEITTENVGELLTATTGYYRLKGDVSMSAYHNSWNPTTTFSGVLDGAGYTISGFTPSSNNALFNRLSGVVKNVAIQLGSAGSGRAGIAFNAGGTVKNVMLTVGATAGSNYGGGVFSRSGSATIENVVVYASPETTDTTFGLVGAFSLNITANNCYFIGGLDDSATGNGAWFGTRDGYPNSITGTYTYYADVEAFSGTALPTTQLTAWATSMLNGYSAPATVDF